YGGVGARLYPFSRRKYDWQSSQLTSWLPGTTTIRFRSRWRCSASATRKSCTLSTSVSSPVSARSPVTATRSGRRPWRTASLVQVGGEPWEKGRVDAVLLGQPRLTKYVVRPELCVGDVQHRDGRSPGTVRDIAGTAGRRTGALDTAGYSEAIDDLRSALAGH